MTDKFPGWRYGPGGKSAIFESEGDVPTGWVDHPSLVKGAAPAPEGVKTAIAPANAGTTPEVAARSTQAKSQTITDPKISAAAGVGGVGNITATGQGDVDNLTGHDAPIDAYGHVYDPALHAATQSQTKAGLWRMKVGVSRPDPKPGYPLDL